MAEIYQNIEVDVSKANFFSAIVAKQHDNLSRYLIVRLKNNDVAIDVESGSDVFIRAKRSDGEKVRADGYTNDDGTVTVPLSYEMLEVVGAVNCEVCIEKKVSGSTNKRRLTTTTFHLQVEESFPDGMEPQNNATLAEIGRARWCAMGDSITQGAYSFYEDGKTPIPGAVDTYDPDDTTGSSYKWELIQAQGNTKYDNDHVISWVPKLAKMKNWKMSFSSDFSLTDNKGIGNTGWVYKKTAGLKMAWEVADKTDFKKYDVVTLMYGVNDWAGNVQRGSISDAFDATSDPKTIVAAMRRIIEKIIADNPHCKIIVITPLNRRGTYNDTRWLKESDNWALGFAKTPVGTLEDVFNTIKSVCEYYGIEMIDMTHASIANRHNLPFVLPDYVHPTPEAHTAIARELCAKINFV